MWTAHGEAEKGVDDFSDSDEERALWRGDI